MKKYFLCGIALSVITATVMFNVSLNYHTENLSETKYAINEQLKLAIDSIVIPLDSVSLSEYMSCTSYYENNISSLLYAFNPKTLILIFHLKE
jgi:hypothetical protein